MKKIKLYKKKVLVDRQGVPVQEIELRSIEFMKVALELYPGNLRGLEKLAQASALYARLKGVTPDMEELLLEESEYVLLKESIDQATGWSPLILHFPEFLDSIRSAENVVLR